MFGEIVLVGISALLTMALGIPLAVRLAQVQVWRRPAPLDGMEKQAFVGRAMFEPVDFGPDLMRWPSEIERPVTRLPEPPWPSATWDDPHFGRAARALVAQQDAAAARDQRPTASEQQQARTRQQHERNQQQQSRAEQQQRAQRELREAKQPERQAQAAKQPGKQKTRPQPQANAQPRQAAQPQPAAPQRREPQAARPASSGSPPLPSKAQVEALIAELGLAGAVQALMRDQGWDFREAAAWLAKVRKG